MSRQLAPSERRTIMIGAIALAALAIVKFGLIPYRVALTDARDQLAAESDALSHERGAVASAQKNPALQQHTDSALQLVTPRLFEGKDDVIATADLASYVGDVARKHHLWLQDGSTRPASSLVGGVRALHIDIRGESDFEGVVEFLEALERGSKAVRIERLDLSRALGGPGNEHAETLVIAATISGFALGDVAVDKSARAVGGTR